MTLASFIQPRAVVCISYAHAAVGCSEPRFSLYLAQRNEKQLQNITEYVQYKSGDAVIFLITIIIIMLFI